MGAIVLVAVVGAMIAGVVVFAVTRNRRPVSGPAGFPRTSPQAMGYPPQQPVYPSAQQPYPPTPHQGHAAPPGQAPQYPSPSTQQPPHPGQHPGQ